MFAAPILLFIVFVAGLWLAIHYLVPAGHALVEGLWRLTHRVASRSQRYVTLGERLDRRFGHYRSYLPVFLIVAAGALVSFPAANLFIEIVEGITEQSDARAAVDSWFWTMSRLYRSSGATWFFTFFTILGTPVALGALVGVVAIVLFFRDRARWALFLVLTTLLGVHWITDIVAGIAAGTVWVLFVTVAYEALRRIRKARAQRAELSSRA